MKHIILLALALAMAIPSSGQELSKKEQRKLDKELRKEQQAEEAAQKAKHVKAMVEHQMFVLEADQLRDKRGTMVNVPSNLNFIAIDSLHSVIQIGSNQYVGMNGVGGITVEGQIGNYKSTFNEKSGSYTLSWYVRTSTGTYDVHMFISSDGRADARVSSNWPGQVNYMGFIVPIPQSRVYKGTSRF